MKQRIRIHKAEPNKGILNYSHLLDAPAGKHGFVETRKGHLYFADGTRARFLGFNVATRSNTPDHETADKMAERFASMGVNIIRLHAADAPVGEGLRRRLERWFDANNRHVRMGGTQGLGSNGGCGVARDHDCLGALVQEALDDVAREGEHRGLVLLAIGGIRGVPEEAEVLVRQLADKGAQHADAPDAGVKHPNEAIPPLAHHASFHVAPSKHSASAGTPLAPRIMPLTVIFLK